MSPSDRHTLCVQPGCKTVIVIGTIDVVLNVLFTTPHHLNGEIDLLGDLHSPGDTVDVEATAEPAAEQVVVDPDLLQWQTGDGGCGGSGAGCDLRADPDIAAVGANVYRAVHRLHSGVRQKRQLIDGLDRARCAGHRLDDVTFLFGGHPALFAACSSCLTRSAVEK